MVSLATTCTVLAQHSDAVKFAHFSPNGKLIAAADADRNIAVWGTEPRDNVLENLRWQISLRHWSDRFRAMDHVRSMIFANDDVLIVASGETLRAIDIATEQQIWYRDAAPENAFMIVTPVSLARGPLNQIACAYANGLIEVYDAGAESPRWAVVDNDGPVRLQFSADGSKIVGSDRFSVCVWDAQTGAKLLKFTPKEKVFGLSASVVADVIVTRSLFHARTHSLADGAVIGEVSTRPGYPSVECSNQSPLFTSVDAWGVSLFNFACEPVSRLDTDYRPIGITFSPAGDLVVTSLDGAVRLYEIDKIS